MWCPKCCGRTKVVGTTTGVKNERFRTCLECGYSFATVEAIKFDNYWREYAKETFTEDNKTKDQQSQES